MLTNSRDIVRRPLQEGLKEKSVKDRTTSIFTRSRGEW